MNKKIGVVLIAAVLVIATVGIVSADAYTNRGFGWDHVNNGAYTQYCGFGYGYGGVYGDGVAEPVVQSVDDAIDRFEEETGIEASGNNVYHMGRWWIINYTGSDGIINQYRVDVYTGEVIDDFGAYNQQQYQPRNNNRFHRGGFGCGMGYGY